MRALPSIVLAFATSLAGPAIGQTGQSVTYSNVLAQFDYGIICFYDQDTGALLANSDVAHGDDALDFATTRTQTIPAVEGLIFGLIAAYPTGQRAEVRSTLTEPSGAQSVEVYQYDEFGDSDGWRIGNVRPEIMGTYRFQAEANGILLYDVSFNVVPASDYLGPVAPCQP